MGKRIEGAVEKQSKKTGGRIDRRIIGETEEKAVGRTDELVYSPQDVQF